ncbi:MAG: hypothetical protein KJ629_01465 [Candidatus Omnitrophica bacterium]|nr:hypothetical protein [Candidatus Omnitrophota bacterium]
MFELHFSREAKNQLKNLKEDKGLAKRYKAVGEAFGKLQSNPRHPGLQTHEYQSLQGPNGEKIFEAYAEQNTPAAYRIFFHYGPDKGVISIISIRPHP